MYTKINHDICAVIIAHNEAEYVKLNVQVLLEELKDTASEIVIVDNYSNDGLREWLTAQNQVSYIICDEKLEGYGQILAVVLEQFGKGRDLLLLRANYFFTPGSIGLMSHILHRAKETAAVAPVGNNFAGEQKCFVGNTYEEAVRVREAMKPETIQTVYVDPDVMLIKADTVGFIETNTSIPQAAVRAYMRKALRQGLSFSIVKNSVCFALGGTKDEQYKMLDAELYIQEKLHQLLYSFGDICYNGIYLYKYLSVMVLGGFNEYNTWQNTSKNADICTWTNDAVEMSTDEEAEKTSRLITKLPKKDVLFITMPDRKEYDGAMVHRVMEGFVASMDDERYIDLEFVALLDNLENVPTKNWHPVVVTTIPKIYGLSEVNKEEVLEFIWVNFIHPLEELLDIKFPATYLAHCLVKAACMLKERGAYIKFYREVFAHVRPQIIIYSHGECMWMTYLRDAALEAGIPTLEINHGVVVPDTYHKHLVYADYLAVYSEVEARMSREQGNDRVLAIGKPGVYDDVSKPEYKYPVTVVSFVSSLEKEILDYAVNLAKQLDKQSYKVIYKVHPAEIWGGEEKRQIEEETGNLQFVEGEVDIRELISISDIIVGIRSSGIFDALPYPMVKVITVKDKAKDFNEAGPNEVLQEVADNGDIIMVENEEGLYREVLNYRRNTMYREKINSFWIADAKDRFRKLVESYL